MVPILSGCGISPSMTVTHQLPSSLADDAMYGDLLGHYGRALPKDDMEVRQECLFRGHDVVMLITAIQNNNVEMKVIRDLNR